MTRPIVMIFATIFTLGMLWGGLVSGGMLVFSSLKGESHSIFLAHLVIFIVSGILLVAVLFIYNRIDKERRKSIIARVKAESGIDFSTGREIGLPSDNWAVFDEPSRKVLISALGGRRVMVHPYEHIKSWKLTWIESSRNGRLRETDAKIEFDLNDLDHSRFVVPMLSKGDGEAWCSRLDTLLSAR